MKKFHHFEANATVPNVEYADTLWPEAASPTALPEVIDVVKTTEFTRVFCAEHWGLVADGSKLALSKSEQVNGYPGGYFVDLPPMGNVKLQERRTLRASPIATEIFADLNVLFAIECNPDPLDVADWLKFNLANAGADAALLIRRLAPGDRVRETSEFRKALQRIETLKTFVLLDYDIPLGKPDHPAESDRMLAPEAPGKALLERPKNDIWRAPLGQFGVYAAARFRFLSEARAVLHCSISDMVKSEADSLFDLAKTGPSYVKVRSRYAYPWKIPNKDMPRIADHSCVRFDSDMGASIWCADPKMAGFWRPFRASSKPPQRLDVELEIWRCMAIRHKHLKLSELVPKSSLVVVPSLVTALEKALGTRAFLPPTVDTKTDALKNERVLIVTTMKDEGPFILEWLAYHRSIGVTDFLVYTNDCSDGTDQMFDLLQAKGHVEHRQNPYREVGLQPQHAAYHDASESTVAAAADWVICMDVDEYINVHVGDGTLHDLFAAVGDANIISLTWRLFGNAGIVDFKDKFITEQFFLSAPKYIRKPHQAWGFKTMFRTLGHYKKYGVHRPKGLRPEMLDQVKWVNGSGRQVPAKMLRTGWRSSAGNWGYGLATLNHYSLRSAESYLVKRFRGRVNHVDRDQGLTYWFRMNNNATEDRSILNKIPLAKLEFDKLMADPEIRAMHERCVGAHKDRVSSLLESPDYKALFDEVTGKRLNVLAQMNHHFGSQVFADGPDSIPADFHTKNATYNEAPPDVPADPKPPAKPFFS
ncbi:hypothetical protein A9Q96_14550 [Rhodobacterales bacterium 52_120_T64]|nr:hypothetical protein A9Q96_14550 [Rhodobacterales bacterium 52_120_T64]